MRALGPARPLPWAKPEARAAAPASDRREPLFGAASRPREAAPLPEPAPEPAATAAGRLVRLVMPGTRSVSTGKRAEHERQSVLDLDGQPILPPIDLLVKPPIGKTETIDEEALQKNARLLEAVLEDYGVRGEIVQVRPGPVVTLYELEPAAGIKASRVIGLADDIARSMSAISVRVAVVPGRSVIGIELPNTKAETVFLRELLDSPAYEKHQGRLALALGKDIGGEAVVADLARMPHLLIAGTTGSGKSVGINTMILSILYRMPPDRCKFIMVDPKMLELSVYDGIPHLLAPVVTDPKKAVMALKWTVREMESRYQKMSKLGVRSIEGFNAALAEARDKGEKLVRKVQTGFDPETGQPIIEEQPFDLTELPLIVVIVDEMADLMLVAGKDIEASVQRLAQMARAAGIHIIMATQRPSVDVITGTIKANFPTRISFQVTSKIDSRTIFGEGGAEQLLGRGDMLYMAGGGRVTRVHGPFVSDEEVERVVPPSKRAPSPTTSRRSPRTTRAAPARRSPAMTTTAAAATSSTTRPSPSSPASARPRPASSSAICRSATTAPRASSSAWRGRRRRHRQPRRPPRGARAGAAVAISPRTILLVMAGLDPAIAAPSANRLSPVANYRSLTRPPTNRRLLTATASRAPGSATGRRRPAPSWPRGRRPRPTPC